MTVQTETFPRVTSPPMTSPPMTSPPAASSPATQKRPRPPVPSCLGAARALVEPELVGLVDRLDAESRRVARYHFGWADADGVPPGRAAGGKALRPALALLSARAAGAAPEAAVRAAAAVELVHNFSLLHDDVMDGDTERRHRATAWTVFGRSAAVLAGDALLALAAEALLEDPGPAAAAATRSLLATVGRLVAGQSLDLRFEQRMDVSLEECLDMAAGKTGALLACSASIGAQVVRGGPGSGSAARPVRRRRRAGLPARRRPARAVGRPGDHRQAGPR
ncbi:MAG: polyprenyl synthetase family protein [Pseudonocardia sp.]|nr:polyprenyl synthetase family protein [Pseudonocardia sp.]